MISAQGVSPCFSFKVGLTPVRSTDPTPGVKPRFFRHLQRAGHILGSAYVEVDIQNPAAPPSLRGAAGDAAVHTPLDRHGPSALEMTVGSLRFLRMGV